MSNPDPVATPNKIIKPAVDRAGDYINPAKMIGGLWSHRQLIGQLGKRQILELYRGSYLGLIWSFITPLVLLVIYTFVFSVIFQAKWDAFITGSREEFALILFAGIIAFNIFGDAVLNAPQLIVTRPNYVKRIVFPLEILPVSAMAPVLLQAFFNLIILLLGSILFLGQISATLYLLPIALLPLILLSLGLGWFLSSLGVFVRDMIHFLRIIVQMFFFLTPIFYPISAVPESFKGWLYINPLTYLVEHFRQVALLGEVPDWGAYGAILLLSAAVCLSGYIWFMKSKKTFADVL
jgi:lipopolysaccharide transport system permease protein